jgi:hypothetical protein
MRLYFTTPQLNATMPLQEALAEYDTFEKGKDVAWPQISRKHDVVRSTLTRPRKEQNCGAAAARSGVVAAEHPAAPRTHITSTPVGWKLVRTRREGPLICSV